MLAVFGHVAVSAGKSDLIATCQADNADSLIGSARDKPDNRPNQFPKLITQKPTLFVYLELP